MTCRRLRIGYLSGAPRVSTRDDAEAAGPRAHVLGMIQAFRSLDHAVEEFIVGDRMMRSVSVKPPEHTFGNMSRRVAADLGRVILGSWNAGKAWRELRGRVDVVYERLCAFQAIGRPFVRRSVPWVLETSAPFFYEAKQERRAMELSGLARRIELNAYRSADLVVCVSAVLGDLVRAEAQIPDCRLLVVPNGVDVSFFDPAGFEAPPDPDKGPVRIGFAGSVIAWQGLDVLVSAIAIATREGFGEFELTIIGDGPEMPALRALVHREGLQQRVQFAGLLPRSSVPRAMSRFHVGFSGQRNLKMGAMYHSPLKMYEYLAMGRPVLASRFADAEATLMDGETGWLFEPGSVESLIAALRSVWSSRRRIRSMGERARDVAVAGHSWAARAALIAAKMEELCARRSG